MGTRMRKPPQSRPLTSFGMWVKLRLLERQMTSVKLCKEVGIPHEEYLSRILHGDVSGDKYIAKIMEVLGDAREKPK